jgi:hypothetical protein
MIIFKININNIEKHKEIPLLCCVKAPTESIFYTKYINNKNVPLAYFKSKENVSQENAYVQDLSWKLPENNPNLISNEPVEYIESLSFSSNYKELLITNKFYVDSQGAEVPLYYKHKTKFRQEPKVTKNVKGNLEIEDSFIYSDGYLYSNLKNIVTDDRYLIWNIAGTDINNKSVNEIYNPVEVIAIGDESCVDDEGNPNKTFYIREERTNTFQYTIARVESGCYDKHTSTGFYIKPVASNLLKLQIRKDLKQDNSWGVIVKNNTIFSNGKYWLPEYDRQPFNPIYGVLKANNQSCKIINASTIKINQSNIFLSKETPLTISFYDSEDNFVKAASFLCCDESTGIVRLSERIESSYKVKASYSFKSNELFYTKLNANPFENDKMIKGRYFFYIKKNVQRGGASLHHLYIDEESRILEVSDEEIALKTSTGAFNTNTYLMKSIEEFKQAFCYGYNNQYQWMELGEVSYRDTCLLEETGLEDIRSFNNLDETRLDSIVKRQWRILQSKYGYGENGQVVQRNNVLVIEVPIKLLQKYGGSYTTNEVEALVKRRIPAGTEVIIDYVYPKSSLTIESSSDLNIIQFSWEGAYSYRLEVSRNKVDWSEIYSVNASSRPNNDLLEYTHSNLDGDTVYYYRCIITEGDVEYPASNIYGVITL